MNVALNSPPPSYKPLPPVASETTDKFRWPASHGGESRRSKLTLNRLPKSPSQEPSLRYHRQSSYTDEFIPQKIFGSMASKMESRWMDPIGKHGKFAGLSSYEADYDWFEIPSKVTRIPLVSTVGLGILPILGGNESKEQTPETSAHRKDEKMDVPKAPSEIRKTFNNIDCVPYEYQALWPGETTHRIGYGLPPKGWKANEAVNIPPDNLKFPEAKMEVCTTSLRDYR